MVLSDFRKLLEDTTGLTWRDYNRAAAYCADNKVNFEEGLEWVETSLGMEKNYSNFTAKSKYFPGHGPN